MAEHVSHKCSDIVAVINQFKQCSVCIVGDLIIDQYIHCIPQPAAQTLSYPFVLPHKTETYIGGAGLVARQIAALGTKRTLLLSAYGEDHYAKAAFHSLEIEGVTPLLTTDNTRRTTVKQRYFVDNNLIFRSSEIDAHPINQRVLKLIKRQFDSVINEVELVILSDFSYGVLTSELITYIQRACTRHGIMIVADSQSVSQQGDICKFNKVSLLTPTEHEARLAVSDDYSSLEIVAKKIHQKTGCPHLLITRGADGLLLSSNQGYEIIQQYLPAYNTNPQDTIGAGDCLLATTALALTSGSPLFEAAELGSKAAAYKVSKLGNHVVTLPILCDLL